ncbi:MAG: hypothetical protein R2697_05245 [Ilumatobacteraceae bacterium]
MTESAGTNQLQARSRRVVRPIATKLWTIHQQGPNTSRCPGRPSCVRITSSFLKLGVLMLTVPHNISFVSKAEYMDSWKTKYVFHHARHDPDRPLRQRERPGCARAAGGARTEQTVRHLPRGRAAAMAATSRRAVRVPPASRYRSAARSSRSTSPAPTTSSRSTPSCRSSASARSRSVDPIHPDRYHGRGPEHLAWRSMIDEVMFEIREMTAQRALQPVQR